MLQRALLVRKPPYISDFERLYLLYLENYAFICFLNAKYPRVMYDFFHDIVTKNGMLLSGGEGYQDYSL